MFAKRSNRRSSGHPAIETLEGRRLLSADLAPLFSQLPVDVNPGSRNHLAVEVANDGDSTARGTVIVDLVAQSTTDGTGALLDTVTRNLNLKAGHDAMVNFRFASPPSLADGNYNLVAQLSTLEVNDAVTSNDVITSAAPVTFTQPFSDVTTESVKAPAQSIVVNARETKQHAGVTIENNGNVAAQGRLAITFYVSTNPILDGQAVQAGTTVVPINLKPGQTKTVRAPITAPGNASGQYYLFAVTNRVSGNVQTLPGHQVGIAITQVKVTVITKVVFFPRSIYYAGPAYQCTPGQVGGTECTDDSGPTDDGSTDNGSTDGGTTTYGGSTDNGSTENGSTDNGSTDNGSTDGGSTDNGSTDSGSTDGGSTDNGSTDNGSTDGGSTDNGSTDNGSTDGGSTDNGSTDNGSTDGGSTDSGSTDNGSTDGGSTDNGSTDNGSTDGGSTDNGSTDNGSTDGGSTDDGSMDDGSTDGGSTDDGSTDGSSTDDGSTDGGSPDGGSTDDGSYDGGSTDDGSDDGGYVDDGSSDGGSADDGSGDDFSTDALVARRSVKTFTPKPHLASHLMLSRPAQARL